jgi:hypothetical protein
VEKRASNIVSGCIGYRARAPNAEETRWFNFTSTQSPFSDVWGFACQHFNSAAFHRLEKSLIPGTTLATMEKNPQSEPSIEGLWKICQDRFAEKTNKVLNFSPPKTLKELRDKIQSQQADYSTK